MVWSLLGQSEAQNSVIRPLFKGLQVTVGVVVWCLVVEEAVHGGVARSSLGFHLMRVGVPQHAGSSPSAVVVRAATCRADDVDLVLVRQRVDPGLELLQCLGQLWAL